MPSRRPFDDLGTIHGKLVYLQSVVVAPLLALVLDAVLGHSHTVEAQAADSGFRLSRANTHGFYAWNAFERLHQAARKVGLQVVVAYLHARLR